MKRLCFASLAVPLLVIATVVIVAGANETPSSRTAQAASAGVVPSEERKPKLEVAWENKQVTLDVVDADIQAVVKALSEKSGVEIKVYEGVTGKVTLRLEKAPLEKAVDSLLVAVGQRNYLMVFDGGGLTKMTIVPKGSGGTALSDEVKRVKVKGKLMTGKEIEYYPGEIWINVKGQARSQEERIQLEDIIHEKEEEFGLSFLKSVRIGFDTQLKFRILDGRDALKLMETISYSTVNGLGPLSTEMPEEDFHVINDTYIGEELEAVRKDKKLRRELFHQRNPFLKRGDILKNGGDIPYREGELTILVMGTDFSWIGWEDIVGLVHDEGGIIYSSGSSVGGNGYLALFPGLRTPEEHAAMIDRLKRNELFKRAKNKSTGVYPVYWSSVE